jgi:hypothetical protein
MSKRINKNYFLFSIQYLMLTTLIYIGLVVASLFIVRGKWVYFIACLGAVLVCLKTVNSSLEAYFTQSYKSRTFSGFMTLLTIFPPAIGPVVVLIYSLGQTT